MKLIVKNISQKRRNDHTGSRTLRSMQNHDIKYIDSR